MTAPAPSDTELERRIRKAEHRCLHAANIADSRRAWNQVVRLIRQRIRVETERLQRLKDSTPGADMSENDEKLEGLIGEALERHLSCVLALKPDLARQAWSEMVMLIGLRSPERVAQMEREQGLT